MPSARLDFGRGISYHWSSDASHVFHLFIYWLLGIFSLIWLVSFTGHSYGADYRIYFNAYLAGRSGDNPYLPYVIGTSFVNHPIVLVLVRLLYFRDAFRSCLNWSTVSIIAWLGCYRIAVLTTNSISRKRTGSQSGDVFSIWLLMMFVLFGPFLETIIVGQVNTIALLLILASFLLSEMEEPILAGISLSLAIVIKMSPIIFLGYFLLIRSYRVVLSAVVGTVLASFVSQIAFPGNIVGQFLEIVPKLLSEIHPTAYNHSLNSIVFRLLSDRVPHNIHLILPLANMLILGVLLVLLFWLGWRSPSISRVRRIWLFACFQIIAVAFSPLVWYHHYIFLLLPLILLLTSTSIVIRILGVSALTLLQAERYFEYYIVWLPWPAMLAMLMILITAFVVLFAFPSMRSIRVFPSE